ncbi:hypothetical protein CTAYLR_003851 [Chrysophaeum taylorii]|uniref:Uncharacterized protein n=1 Tax=Chrysophaeum taylorii TaxID=2483200 RepID=A0AAD7UDN0_9STRA|nr:hypothetical protein CTAYLR_003851 [Chrysophaeum taylorii]
MKKLFRKKKKNEEEPAPGKTSSDEFAVKIREELSQSGALSMSDFQLQKVLGKGSFGKVMLVTKKDDPERLLAMKTLRKAALLKRNQITHTKTERHVLQHLDHPFLVKLLYAFQTPDKLYMVLEYMAGGELFHWLKQHKRFSESRTRLYGAEIGLGLSGLHALDIVYRDLKPENLLLDIQGHIRITDFGLAKEHVTQSSGAKTFCGTPEYLAPEILENRGHGKAVDWWSFGTLLYEMMGGLPPFYDTNVQKMYQKILNAPLKIHPHFSPNAKTLLIALLERKVDRRLGSVNDFDDIKVHPFFRSLDMDMVYQKKYKPEFAPPQKGAGDAAHFDDEFTSQAALDSVVQSKLSDAQAKKAHFPGFTYEGEPSKIDDDNNNKNSSSS